MELCPINLFLQAGSIYTGRVCKSKLVKRKQLFEFLGKEAPLDDAPAEGKFRIDWKLDRGNLINIRRARDYFARFEFPGNIDLIDFLLQRNFTTVNF